MKAGEVFAEAVGVVGGFFKLAGGSKEEAARVGEGAGVAADSDNAGELRAIKQVNLGEIFRV